MRRACKGTICDAKAVTHLCAALRLKPILKDKMRPSRLSFALSKYKLYVEVSLNFRRAAV